MKRTLLIDADLLAYKASAANERRYDWGDGVKSVASDLREAQTYAEENIERLANRLKADDVTICLSDDFKSFREDRVDPTYKLFRETVERPRYLYDLKDWLRQEYGAEERPTLEADDVMGLLATDPTRTDERIIVSADKDLMGVPGKLYRPQLQKGKRPIIFEITQLEAIRFHFWQTLVGDTTDGFLGARGIGPASDYALDVLEAETEEEAWDIVLAGYGSKGFTEEDAVKTARLARILQHGDYDGKAVKLWLPPWWEEDDAEDA